MKSPKNHPESMLPDDERKAVENYKKKTAAGEKKITTIRAITFLLDKGLPLEFFSVEKKVVDDLKDTDNSAKKYIGYFRHFLCQYKSKIKDDNVKEWATASRYSLTHENLKKIKREFLNGDNNKLAYAFVDTYPNKKSGLSVFPSLRFIEENFDGESFTSIATNQSFSKENKRVSKVPKKRRTIDDKHISRSRPFFKWLESKKGIEKCEEFGIPPISKDSDDVSLTDSIDGTEEGSKTS